MPPSAKYSKKKKFHTASPAQDMLALEDGVMKQYKPHTSI